MRNSVGNARTLYTMLMEPPKTAPELPGSDPIHEPQLVRLNRTAPQPALPVEELDEPDELNEHVEEPGDPDGVVEREVFESMPKPEPAAMPLAKRRKHHPFLKALLILVIIAALAVGVYYFASKAADKSNKPAASKNTTSQTKKPAATVAATKQYSSDAFALSFNYPTDWKVAETAASITATSPTTSLPTASGTTKGVAVLTIQNQQTTIPNYPANGALESIESPKLTYANPSGVQRAQTYLSYLGYTNTNVISALFITGDNGYQQGQQVPMSDVVKGNPLVSVQFMTCSATDCAGTTSQPLSIKSSSWSALPLQSQVTKMLESIVFN